MGVFEEVERDAAAVGHGITGLFRQQHPRPGDPPRPSFTPHDQSQSPQPEVHMPSALLTDAEKAAKALVTHVSALLGNPLVDAIVEAGLGMVLTPGETSAVIAFIQAIESERTQQAAPVQPSAPAQAASTPPQAAQARQAPAVV